MTTVAGVPELIESLMLAAIRPAGEAYSAELARHMPGWRAGQHACTCGWMSDRPTERGGAIAQGRHLADVDRAAEDRYNARVRNIAASLARAA